MERELTVISLFDSESPTRPSATLAGAGAGHTCIRGCDIADRSWNAVDARLYDEDYPLATVITFAWLLAVCPNLYGIFDFPKRRLFMLFREELTDEQIDLAITHWQDAGWLRLYRDGKVCWIVKKFKRESFKPRADKQVTGVENFLADFPEVKADFLALYPYQPPANPSETPSKGVRNPSVTTDPDPDPDPESERNKSAAVVAYPPDASREEREILAEMKDWRGIGPLNYSGWLKAIRKIAVDFPTVDMLETAKTLTLWLDKPKNQRENGSTLRLRNFCKTEANSEPRQYSNGHNAPEVISDRDGWDGSYAK